MAFVRSALLAPAVALVAGAGLLSRAPLEPIPGDVPAQRAPALAGFTAAPGGAAGMEGAAGTAGAPAGTFLPGGTPAVLSTPFGLGERARYRVSYNVVGRVGTGEMHIVAVDTVRGRPAYRIVNTLQGRMLLARVNNRFESWLDVQDVYSHRFVQNTHEINFRRRRVREFFPAERRWTGHTNDRPEAGSLVTGQPLDDTSFLYFARTLELQVGREYTFDRYWNPEGNPVRIQVLRRETVTVPAGTFETLVLRPIIQTSGMFADGGEAEVYYSVTPPRQLVMLRAKVSIGTLQMQLEEFQPGRTR
jgi:hypothetical protein